VIAAGLAVFVSQRTATDGAAVLIVVAGSLWFAATRRTALALVLLMLYLGLLDGYLKLATGSTLVTFVRDVLLYAIVVGLLARAVIRRDRFVVPPLGAWVIGFSVVVLVELANPNNGSLVHSLAGVRQHLEFVPLFFLTYAFVRTKKALRTFVILTAVIAAANGLANVVQFRLTPAQFAAWGPGYAQRVLGTGAFTYSGRSFYDTSGQTHTRPFGLMSDAGSGGLMAALALGAVIALVALPGDRRYRGLAVVTGVAAIAGIATAQGRAVVVVGGVVVLAYALLTATSRRGVTTALAVGALAVAGFAIVEGAIGSGGVSPLRYSSLNAGNLLSTTSQVRGSSFTVLPKYFSQHPLGDGLGVAGPATGTSGAPPQAGILDAENEISFLTLESGIPGMVLLIGFATTLCVLGLLRVRREPDPEVRVLLAAIIAPVVGMLAYFLVAAGTPTTPAGPYLWAIGGVVSYWLVDRPAALRRTGDRPTSRA
jgi:hypothetical protein